MKFLITGATGLVGSKLIEQLYLKGFSEINVLTRDKSKAVQKANLPVTFYNWNPSKNEIELDAFEGVDYVIHLAGENVADGRWSKERKERILNSRINGTNLIVNTVRNLEKKPKKIISASAIGIYGDRASEELTESSEHAKDFLANVCEQWEAPIVNMDISGVKGHVIRVGIVLSTEGGALSKMLPPFKAGVGGILGNGKQYMSWIHIEDLVNQFIYVATHEVKHTIFNGVSPQPVTNFQFTKILGRALKRPTLFPVPTIGLKVLFGEMSSILIGSQNVHPTNFWDESYGFKFQSLEKALEDLFKYDKNGEELFVQYQWVNKPPQKVFKFFSDEKNLEKITPKFLNFKVEKSSTPTIQTGSLIDYTLKLHGIPMRWRTKIKDFQNDKSFIDEQIKGPYSKWEHTHDFIPIGNGTLMRDRVVYKLPLGFLGRILAGFFVRKDINNIFNYRKSVIGKLFA